MAIRQVKVSDLDGVEGASASVVVREYPGMDQSKVLDVTPEQAEALSDKAVKNLVTVEVRLFDGETREVNVTKTEFDKWTGGKTDDVLAHAAYTRGRRPGSKVNGNGG